MACPEAMKAHMILLHARIRPRERQLHSFQGTSVPMTPAFSTDSADTSPTLTAWSSDFRRTGQLGLPRRYRQGGNPSYNRPQ